MEEIYEDDVKEWGNAGRNQIPIRDKSQTVQDGSKRDEGCKSEVGSERNEDPGRTIQSRGNRRGVEYY